MKRLATLGSWKRLGLQAGLLSGLGLAFVAAPEPVDAGERDCVIEGTCTFKKPNLMIIVDYSSSMNEDFGATNRWDATVDAIVAMIDADNGFLGDNLNLGLMRFGHDPSTNPGSTITGDTSNPPITDGQALDVHWFDNSAGASDTAYVECNGEAVKDAIQAVPSPLCNAGANCSGIGTWTKGALDLSQSLIAESQTVHAEAPDERVYLNLVLTDGAWSEQDGSGQNAGDDPSITAAALFASATNVSTYVVAVAADQALIDLADELAVAGGTMQAIDGSTPAILVTQLQGVVQAIKDDLIQPECVGGMPRVMVILDASSSMINDGNTHAGAAGDSGWDQAAAALGGANSIFDIVLTSGNTVEDLSQLGVLVFGSNNPAEEEVLVDYGPCMKDNFAWALDPNNSCVAPGCTDPYAGPDITWTSQDGSIVAPMFDVPTISHMPQCGQGNIGDTRCLGSGTYTHLGLELASSNQLAYHAAATQPGAEFPAGTGTTYINILITDGDYSASSPAVDVENSLVEMYNRGITTYVIGFGGFGGFQAQLDEMQDWGSGGNIANAFTAANQAQLQMELEGILNGLPFDACCGFNDCSVNPEPTTNEPDPTTGSGTTAGDGDGDGDGSTTGDGDGDGDGSTTGDGDGDSSTSGDGDGDSSTSGDGDGDSSTTGDGDGDGSGSGEAGSGETGTADGTGDGTGDGSGGSGSDGDGSGEAGSGESGDETGPGVDDAGLDDGCNCSAANDTKGGFLASLLGLGLLGFTRRRRRRRD